MMKYRRMKWISKLLAAVMIATLALPQGGFVIKEKTADNYVMAAEVSGADTNGTESDEQESSTEEPSTEEAPPTEESTTEDPSTEEPTTVEPTTEETTTEEPTTEEPTVNPDFVISNGILVGYKKEATDKTNKEIEIPASVVRIDDKVFYQYKYIEKVTFEQGSQLKEIGEWSFRDCTALKSIELPEGLQVIGADAFRNCTAVTEIKLPSTLLAIYKRAFYGLKNVKELILPEGLQTIRYRAFYKMTGLKSLTIPSTVTSTYEIIGANSKVTTVTFAAGMTKIPNKVLMNATSVKKVVFPTGLLEIGADAFNGCTALSTATMKKTVTKIGARAFKNCTTIKKIVLYKAVKSIGTEAFAGATSLILRVYANSTGKTYARKNNIPWDYTADEKIRMAEDQRVYNNFANNCVNSLKDKYLLQSLTNYIPQGTCVIGKYVVVSMYHKKLTSKSILLVYDKKGNFVKKLKLTVKDHVGSITNVKKNLVVGINNLPGSADKVGVITYANLKKAKNGSTIKFGYKVSLVGSADFAAFDGTHYWAGRSANSSNCLMYGYKVTKDKKTKRLVFKNQYNLCVPANTQGLSVKKVSSKKRTFTISQSYGRIADSYLKVYKSVNIQTASALDTPATTVVMPSMMEGICVSGTKTYIVFESAAGLYCSNVDNTSEIQIDKVKIIKTSKLLTLK